MGRSAADNPYVPGFGNTPPALVGREPEFRDVEVMVGRLRRGLYEQPRALVGDRGMGKTALLIELAVWAAEQDVWHIDLQALEHGDATVQLIRDLRDTLLAHDRDARVGNAARQALRVLAAFALRHQGSEIEIALRPSTERGGTGDLATDLGDVLIEVSSAAARAGTALLVMIDEVQKMPAAQLEALLAAVQRLYRRRPDPTSVLPFGLVVAGLPNTVTVLRERGGTFAERVRIHELVALSDAEVFEALAVPAEQRGVRYQPDALRLLAEASGGWPVAVQQHGYEAWNAGRSATITPGDAQRGVKAARRQLAAVYDSRVGDLPERELEYLVGAAWTEPHDRTTAAVAHALGKTSSEVAPYRRRLIERRSLLRSDGRGRVAFTLPGLDTHVRERFARP